jgi:hypothetical protein
MPVFRTSSRMAVPLRFAASYSQNHSNFRSTGMLGCSVPKPLLPIQAVGPLGNN